MCSTFLVSPNPRVSTCSRCGRGQEHHDHPAAEYMDEPRTFPRNLERERMLTDLAAKSVGLTGDAGLRAFADRRAAPGGVRERLDAVQEAAEELGDASNYLCWGIERVYDAMLAGDSEATATYERLMRSLAGVVVAWDALVRG